MFAALGRLVSRHPWSVLGAWVALTAIVIAFAPGLKSTTDQSDFLPKHYESIQATNLITEAFPKQEDAGATIVFDHSDGSALTGADIKKISAIASSLQLPDAFTQAEPVAVSPTRMAAIVNLDMSKTANPQDKAVLDQVKTLRDEIAQATQGTGLRAQSTGTLPESYDQQQSGSSAEAIVLLATIILILVLLGIIFRSVLAALTPIISVVLLYVVSNGAIGTAAKLFNLQVDSSLSVIVGIVLFGIGTDYYLFFLYRYREARRQGVEKREAIAHGIERGGEAIASAGGAVIIAFATLALSSLGMFRSMGPALAIAVAVALIGALTLIPAIATLLGNALFWPSKKWAIPSEATRFGRIGQSLGKHPVRYLAASAGALIVLAVFALGFNPTFDLSASNSSQKVESAQATSTMEDKGFSAGATQPTPIVIHSDSALDTKALPGYVAELAKVPGVAAVSPQAIPAPDGKTALVMVTLKDAPSSDGALSTIADQLRPAAHSGAATMGATAYVGGLSSVFVDFRSAMNRDYAVVFPIAALIIMLILAVVLRALVAPLYLMVSVGLGFAATLGTSVIVFEHIKGDSGMIFMLPVLIYLFVVALGTDYNILMITRLREEARSGKGPREAAAEAVHHAGPTIAVAGVILAGTFASLMLGGASFLVTLGFSVAIGIVLSAFIMAMFFTPALTALVGHAAWWPGHGDEKKVVEPEKQLV